MKKKLEQIVGKNILNGESSSGTVVRLAKVINYLSIQMDIVKKELEPNSYIVNHIESVQESAKEMLEETDSKDVQT